MEQADKIAFVSVLNGLAAVKPGAKLTPEALDVWWSSFRDWTIEEFRSAAAMLAKSREFFPNPYHFEQLRKASQLTAGEAWAEVLAIARNGGDEHEDDLVNRAVRAIGGYNAIAMSKTDSTHFLERRFAEHYEQIRDVNETREAVPLLAGPVTKLLKQLSQEKSL
jgi:hypothetical protein